MDDWFTDPITLETLECPVLASDGMTYSLTSLQAAMAADPWHRSPITQDVLRPYAYPNAFVAEYMGVDTVPNAVRLYDDDARPPVDARIVTLTLPVGVSAEEALVRAAWKLPIETVTLRAVLRRSELNEWYAMHPPPLIDAQDAFTNLGIVFGLGFAKNPACITSAVFVFGTGTMTTEAWFIEHVRG